MTKIQTDKKKIMRQEGERGKKRKKKLSTSVFIYLNK